MKKFTKQKLYGTLAALCILVQPALAQLNCDGITEMYGMFNRKTTNASKATYIAPISYATGSVGVALGGVFVVPYTTNASLGYYGSTTLAADAATNRFYFLNRDVDSKAVYTKTTGAAPVQTGLTPASLDHFWFVKLGVSSNGYVYSLSTRQQQGSEKFYTMPTRMIRFNTCGTAGCATIDDVGTLAISSSSFAYKQYNGDLAFVQNGDMYIFTSEYDTLTFNYTWSRIYKVNAIDVPTVANPANVIPVQYIGTVSGLGSVAGDDTLAVSGIAFDGAGKFYLGAVDEATGSRSYLFKGTSAIGAVTTVAQVPTFGALPAGYQLTDLASCVYPNIVALPNVLFKLDGEKKPSGNQVMLTWEDNMAVDVRSYTIERQLDNGNYEVIGSVDAADIGTDKLFRYTDQLLPYDYETVNYRIKSNLLNGAYSLSNTVAINGNTNKNMRVLKNPFRNAIELEINATRTGNMNIQVFQETGKIVYQKTISVKKGKNTVTLSDVQNLVKGVYVVKASNEDMMVSSKVIKQ